MGQQTIDPEKNKQLIKRYYSLFAEGGDVPFEQFFAPSFIDHNGYPGQASGPEGVRGGYEAWRKAFHISDFKLVEGRQQDEYFYKSLSDKTVVVEAISRFRISEGKIQERWGLTAMNDYGETI